MRATRRVMVMSMPMAMKMLMVRMIIVAMLLALVQATVTREIWIPGNSYEILATIAMHIRSPIPYTAKDR